MAGWGGGAEGGGNVLVINALNTFYLRLYDIGYIVNYHGGSQRRNTTPPRSASKGSCMCAIPLTYHDLCYTSRGALAETRNSSMGPP